MSVSMDTKAISLFKVPVVAAPMFLVSGIELVVAAANAGIVGEWVMRGEERTNESRRVGSFESA